MSVIHFALPISLMHTCWRYNNLPFTSSVNCHIPNIPTIADDRIFPVAPSLHEIVVSFNLSKAITFSELLLPLRRRAVNPNVDSESTCREILVDKMTGNDETIQSYAPLPEQNNVIFSPTQNCVLFDNSPSISISRADPVSNNNNLKKNKRCYYCC